MGPQRVWSCDVCISELCALWRHDGWSLRVQVDTTCMLGLRHGAWVFLRVGEDWRGPVWSWWRAGSLVDRTQEAMQRSERQRVAARPSRRRRPVSPRVKTAHVPGVCGKDRHAPGSVQNF
eukprot:3612223-Prymnesium_polylepis.1